MPPKKRAGSDADSLDGSTASAPAKRQRVSLACDACRAAREKCDGAKPICGTCVAQSRSCSYTPTSKKRGVQTGYLRTIELSLAWLFDQVPESEKALHRLLVSNDGSDGARVLGKTDKAGHRLHKRWTKSRVHKEIGRVLSDDRTPRSDNSPECSDTDGEDDDANAHGAWPKANGGARHTIHQPSYPLKLPLNWRRLIDIYFAYTHCWLPILDRNAVVDTAASYPPEGLALDTHANAHTTSCHAELWAALAVAAFQDASSSHPPSNASSPDSIYSVACSLTPSDSEADLAHLRALLLQALVLIGRADEVEAWLLVGKTARLALHMYSTGQLYPESDHMYPEHSDVEPLNKPGTRVFAACFFLDTITSLCLGQAPCLKASTHDFLPAISLAVSSSPAEAWTSISGLGPAPDLDTSPPLTHPILAFHQLYKFSKVLNANAEFKLHQCPSSRGITPDDLVRTLDAQFSFCSSLIFGGSTPVVPSAFLLQSTFLTATVSLSSGHRTSLLSSFMEVVESCVSHFGACGTPPVMVALLGIIHRGRHVENLHDAERSRWSLTMETLKGVWRPSASNATAGKLYNNAPHQPPANAQSFTQSLLTPTYQDSQDGPGAGSAPGYTLPPVDQPVDQFAPYERPGLTTPSPAQHSRPMPLGNMVFQSPSGRGLQGMAYGPNTANPHIDYDAILEELGSIDCTDNIDVDPQFMTNLGFTPGYNLGEMFQEDFGA